MASVVQICAVEQIQEFGVLNVVIPGQRHPFANGLARVVFFQFQRTLGVALVRIVLFEHRSEQGILVAEVVIEHALVDACTLRNLVHTRAT